MLLFFKNAKKKYETTEIKLVNREIKKVKNKKRTTRKSETARMRKNREKRTMRKAILFIENREELNLCTFTKDLTRTL